MNRLASAAVYPARVAVRTGRRVLRTLFFGRVVERMKRTGPVEDLDVLVNLAMRGYWNAITPIQNRHEILTLLPCSSRSAPDGFSRSGPPAGGHSSCSPESPRPMPSW